MFSMLPERPQWVEYRRLTAKHGGFEAVPIKQAYCNHESLPTTESRLIRPIPRRFVQHPLPNDLRLAEVFFERDGVAWRVFV